MRIVFFGTPEFAVSSLDAVIAAGYNVVGVVTAPDKPAGRGLTIHESAVKKYALSHQIPILQPQKLKDENFLVSLKAWRADIQIVIAFRMLPEMVWNMPPLGTFNLHASLLPQYRGAAPINRAVMNGETISGLTTFFLKHEIDTGNIVLQKRLEIGPDETAGVLHDRMMIAGADLVVETLRLVSQGEHLGKPQEMAGELKTAPKIFKDDCKIDWTLKVGQIYNQIRGLSPYPTAFCFYGKEVFKIYDCTFETLEHTHEPGTFLISDFRMRIACTGGYILPSVIQAEGKRKMDIKSFLIGFRPEEKSILYRFS